MEKKISPLHILVLLVFAGATIYFNVKSKKSTDERFLAPPPRYLEHFTFGFSDSLADSLWMRWIQDSDSCQVYKEVETPDVPIRKGDKEFVSPRHKICDGSWSFQMLDAVTTIAPKFQMPYEAGAVFLSVLVEDYDGAKIIFDRGVQNYPDDWKVLYRAAYHYLFDRQEYDRAAELLIRASKAGAPSWVEMLAARIYTKNGRKELGISTLEAFKSRLTDPKDIANVQKRIDELKNMKDD